MKSLFFAQSFVYFIVRTKSGVVKYNFFYVGKATRKHVAHRVEDFICKKSLLSIKQRVEEK